MDDSVGLTIGEVARRAGLATSSIRYYESIGLLPEPERLHGQRRYGTDVLDTLAFVGIAQGAGFKLEEIKELMRGSDDARGMGDRMRALSSRKLDEVESALELARARKGWLEVANTCDCESPADCALFPAPGEELEASAALKVVLVEGGSCRREAAASAHA